MFSFSNFSNRIPSGFIIERQRLPSPEELNKLLSSCKERTYSPNKLSIALQRSFCNLSIFEEKSGNLFGFVRATSDKGLNANIWNLVAKPGKYQEQFTYLLVNNIVVIIKREMPGCSISVSAPKIAFKALQNQGFLIDPNGIRAMAYRLK